MRKMRREGVMWAQRRVAWDWRSRHRVGAQSILHWPVESEVRRVSTGGTSSSWALYIKEAELLLVDFPSPTS